MLIKLILIFIAVDTTFLLSACEYQFIKIHILVLTSPSLLTFITVFEFLISIEVEGSYFPLCCQQNVNLFDSCVNNNLYFGEQFLL